MDLCNKVSVGPTGGETFTVTCFTCGMPSSKEWAQRVRSRPLPLHLPQEPFFPFLMELGSPPLPGAIVLEDGSTFLCAFCHALLESQWTRYEHKGRDGIPSHERSYSVTKFICAVCGVETYRKRVRALPFQEFPFLVKQRQPNSITLGNNPLAVVCLDCSETLWAQSAEYDRWGLPVHKRHFNWMARPPPPEDSVEATVARLPSGETQLPRCPPTDPLVPPKTNEPTAQPEAIPPVKPHRSKISGGHYSAHGSRYPSSSSHDLNNVHMGSSSSSSSGGRKVSATQAPHPQLHMGDSHSSTPPIVTVAPMSTQNTLTNSRKDSFSAYQQHPSSSSSSTSTSTSGGGGNKFESPTMTLGHSAFHQGSSMYSQQGPFRTGGTFPWPSDLPQPHPLYPSESHHPSNPSPPQHLPPWPWPSLAPDSPEFLRYHQAYLNSIQQQQRSLSEAYFPQLYPPTSSASYLPVHLQQPSPRGTSPPSSRYAASPTLSLSPLLHHQRSTTHQGRSPPRVGDPHHHERSPDSPPFIQRRSSLSLRATHHSHNRVQLQSEDSSSESNNEQQRRSAEDGESSGDIHSRLRKISAAGRQQQPEEQKRTTSTVVTLPKKRHWQPPQGPSSDQEGSSSSSGTQSRVAFGGESSTLTLERKRKIAVGSLLGGPVEGGAVDFSVRRKFSSPAEGAMDLSVPSLTSKTAETSGTTTSRTRTYSCPSGGSSSSSKFSIAFLSKSECTSETPKSDEGAKKRSEVTEEEEEPREGAKDESQKEETEEKVKTEEEEVKKDEEEVKEEGEEHVVGWVGVEEVVLNPGQFIQQTISEYLTEEKEVRRRRFRDRVHQLDFLSQLGLITPEKKQKLVLDQIVSRSIKGTVTPLKFRPSTPPNKTEVTLLTRVKERSYSFPRTEEERRKVEYLTSLGLHPTTTRHCSLVDLREGDEQEEERLVEEKVQEGISDDPHSSEVKVEFPGRVTGICINYPMYVPSYATAKTSPEDTAKDIDDEKKPDVINDDLLNVPHGESKPAETILKIPTLSGRRQRADASGGPSSEDSSVNPSSWSNIQEILKDSKDHWKRTKERLLEALESEEVKLSDVSHVLNHLKTLEGDCRATEGAWLLKELELRRRKQ